MSKKIKNIGGKKIMWTNHKFPTDQYIPTPYEKTQIVTHHTASGPGVRGDISWWLQTAQRIATTLIIDRKGEVHELFPHWMFGHHLGVKSSFIRKMGTNRSNLTMNKHTIGIELDSWGPLEYKNGIWTGWAPGSKVSEENIYEYEGSGFRGNKVYEKYTDKQIETLMYILVHLCQEHDIPLIYRDSMWDVSKNAMNGQKGIWTHVSFRDDKTDCHPQHNLINALKNTATIYGALSTDI